MPPRSRLRALVWASAVAVVLVLAAFLAVRLSQSSPAPGPAQLGLNSPPARALPAPARPAFAVPEPRPLRLSPAVTRWSNVIRAAPVHAAPSPDAKVIAWLRTRTPERTTNVVLVVGRATDEAGRLWIAVRVPALPRNVTGWVPRGALGGYTWVDRHLVIDLRRLTATLFEHGRAIFSARVGVGKASSPTPTGVFYIRSKLISVGSPFYGPLAFGTSARSNVLTDWPRGGFIGIHGTDQPQLLPGRVSHGCIRMRNADILELGRLMPVGTRVTIR
jgi:L,D-transpeptidase catalytic domain